METYAGNCDEYTLIVIKRLYQEKMNINTSDFIVHFLSNKYEEIIQETPEEYKIEMKKRGFLKETGRLTVSGVLYIININ